MVETTEQYRTRIAQLKTSIENEPLIRKMRGDIAEGISKTGNRQADIEVQFQSVIDGTTGKDVISAPEIIAARNGETNLKTRLDKKEQEVTAQLAQKATKGDIGITDLNKNKTQFDQTWITDEFKQQIIGNTPLNATPADGSLITVKYARKSVTPDKLSGSEVVEEFDIHNSEKFLQTASADAIFFKKEPITKVARVSIEYKATKVQSGSIVILKKVDLEITLVKVIPYTSDIGMNYIETDYITTGEGNEYVGMYNTGYAYHSEDYVIGNYNTGLIDASNIKEGATFVVGNATTTGKIRLGYNVVLTDIELARNISNLRTQIQKSSEVTALSLFSEYLLNGGDGVMIGDSNTAGVGTTGYSQNGTLVGNSGILSSPNSHNWTNRLVETTEKINPICKLRNWGISGWTSLSFLNAGIANFIKSTDKIAIIMIGTNDRIKTVTSNSAIFETRIQQIIDHCNSISVPVILMSCIPAAIVNDNNTDTYSFDTFTIRNIIKKVSDKNGVPFIDNYDWFLQYKENNGSDEVLYSDDLHMTDFGSYEYLFRNVANNLGISYRRDGVIR